jgi:hypothetical protein
VHRADLAWEQALLPARLLEQLLERLLTADLRGAVVPPLASRQQRDRQLCS